MLSRNSRVAEDSVVTLHPAEAVVDVSGDGHVSNRPSRYLGDRHPVHSLTQRRVVEGLVDHEDVDVTKLLLELEVARVLQQAQVVGLTTDGYGASVLHCQHVGLLTPH